MKHIFVSALLAIGLASNAQSPRFLPSETPNMSDTLLAKFFNTEELQEIIQTKTTYYDCWRPNERHQFDVAGDPEVLSIYLHADSTAVSKTSVSHWGGWDVMVFYFADNSYLYTAFKMVNGIPILEAVLDAKRM